MKTPNKNELVSFDGLDEAVVVEHFLGRTQEDAYEMFRANGPLYGEDLMWMAMSGFKYYLQSAWRYLQSPDSDGDDEFASCLLASVEFQARYYDVDLALAGQIREICEFIRVNAKKFGDSRDYIVARLNEIDSCLVRYKN